VNGASVTGIATQGGAVTSTGIAFALPGTTVSQVIVRFFNIKITTSVAWASGPRFQLADNTSYTSPTYNGVVAGNNAGSTKPFYSDGIPLWNADSAGNFSNTMRFSGVIRLYRTVDEWFVEGQIYRDDLANLYNAQVAGRVLLGTTGFLNNFRLFGSGIDTAASGYVGLTYI
jgi:hypothetical protein